MTFERSVLGQKNRALFYGVDWILYTEGGDRDSTKARSFDALFWSGVFNALGRPLKFRAIPKGSKTQLLPIAEMVRNGTLENVIVAMDRDYDEVFEKIIDHPRVIYTFGYSFENDLYFRDGVVETFIRNFAYEVEENEVRVIVDRLVESMIATLRWPSKADALAFHHGVAGFDRGKPQKYLVSTAYGSVPKICADRVRAEVTRITNECKSSSKGRFGLPAISEFLIYGHLWAAYTFRMVCYLHKQFSLLAKPTNDNFKTSAMSQFQIMLLRDGGGHPVLDHYVQSVRRALS